MYKNLCILLLFFLLDKISAESCCESCPDRKNLQMLLMNPVSESACGSCLKPIYLVENARNVRILCEPCDNEAAVQKHNFVWDLPKDVDNSSYKVITNGSQSILEILSVNSSHSGHYNCNSKTGGITFREIRICKAIGKPIDVSCMSKSSNTSQIFISCTWKMPSGHECSTQVSAVYLQDSLKRKSLDLNGRCVSRCKTAATSVGGLGFKKKFTLFIGLESRAQPQQIFQFQFPNISSIYEAGWKRIITQSVSHDSVIIEWDVPNSVFHQQCPSTSSIFAAHLVIIRTASDKKEIRKFDALPLARDAQLGKDTRHFHSCMAHATIDSLVPFQQYRVMLQYGLRHSKHMSPKRTILFETLGSSPTNANIQLLPGAIFPLGDECRAYWKEIPKKLHYGRRFTILSEAGTVHQGNSFVSFACDTKDLVLSCRNDIGPCLNTSTVHVEESRKLHPVQTVITRRETNSNLSTVFWESKHNGHSGNISVLWCLAEQWIHCKTGLQQQFVPKHKNNFTTIIAAQKPVVFAVSQCYSNACSLPVESVRTFSALGSPAAVKDLGLSPTGFDEGSFTVHWRPPHPVELWKGLPMTYHLSYSSFNTKDNLTRFHTEAIEWSQLLEESELAVEINCSMFSYQSVFINVQAINWPTNSAGPLTRAKLGCPVPTDVVKGVGFWVGVAAFLAAVVSLILVFGVIRVLCKKGKYSLKQRVYDAWETIVRIPGSAPDENRNVDESDRSNSSSGTYRRSVSSDNIYMEIHDALNPTCTTPLLPRVPSTAIPLAPLMLPKKPEKQQELPTLFLPSVYAESVGILFLPYNSHNTTDFKVETPVTIAPPAAKSVQCIRTRISLKLQDAYVEPHFAAERRSSGLRTAHSGSKHQSTSSEMNSISKSLNEYADHGL